MEHATQHLGPTVVHAASVPLAHPALPGRRRASINSLLGTRIQRTLGKKWNHAHRHRDDDAVVPRRAAGLRADARAAPATSGSSRTRSGTCSPPATCGSTWPSRLDPLSMMMVLIITFVGTLIHVYSVGYMADEPSYWRFFAYLNLFVFSMLLLVLGDNFVVMFFGWEGVGLCSYLLIGFWYTDIEKAKAGMKAFVVNRVGDFGFILGLFLLFWSLGGIWEPRADAALGHLRAGDWLQGRPGRAEPLRVHRARAPSSSTGTPSGSAPRSTSASCATRWSSRPPGVGEHLRHQKLWGVALLTLVGMLMFVGAMGKSAQLPALRLAARRHGRPHAGLGPHPRRHHGHGRRLHGRAALLPLRAVPHGHGLGGHHRASSPPSSPPPSASSSTTSRRCWPTPRCRQLGFMFVGGRAWAPTGPASTTCSPTPSSRPASSSASGSVILGCHHEQDMRKMGGLKKLMPITAWTYLIATWRHRRLPLG